MIYATVKLTITDNDKFAAYVERAGEAVKKYGGAPIARSSSPQRPAQLSQCAAPRQSTEVV